MQTESQTSSLTYPPASPAPLFPADPMPHHQGRVIELFAGVGGFRLGLERAGWRVVLGNQWEPSTRRQHAFECYHGHFGCDGGEDVNEDIAKVLDAADRGERELPAYELLVGGFPCQDYSVAKPLNQASGIHGKKGVLWWQIHRLLEKTNPPLVFLENVDRLLKSPGSQRGRDFAIMMASLAQLDYMVEWRVVNAADYGFPQRRRRVFIVARHSHDADLVNGLDILYSTGVLARSLPVKVAPFPSLFETSPAPDFHLGSDLFDLSQGFGQGLTVSPFQNAGVMVGGAVWSRRVEPDHQGPRQMLGDLLQDESEVPEEYFVPEDQLDKWRYLKGAKREERTHRGSGVSYFYTEGALPFPDPLDRPARTILTAEGGSSPSRFKHVVQAPSGRYRRLTPVELERINGFPDGWTAGLSPSKRAFCMGNALVVGLVERVGRVLAAELSEVTITA